MKNVRILFFILFLGMSIIASVVVLHRSIAQDKTQQVLDVACIAKDVPTFKDCLEQVQENKTDFIKITEMIVCTNQQDCAFRLADIKRSVIIYGASNTDSGFVRSGDFSYSLFTLQNVSNLSIGGFLIDDGAAVCPSGTSCPPLIAISGSEKVLVEAVHTKFAKNTAVLITDSKKTIVSKSLFRESQTHAVVVSNSVDTTIADNRFENSWSNALIFSSLGTNSIVRNKFSHNQYKGMYADCGTTCTGAQMIIGQNTGTVSVEKNTLVDGNVDVYGSFGLTTSGIELAGKDIEKVVLRCNQVTTNSGNGIVVANREDSFKSLIIEKNTMLLNGIDLNVIPRSSDAIDDNCYTDSCRVSSC